VKRGTILIIGGGLGGTAAALGLARRGFTVRIFEQSPALKEVGAGLTVSQGAMRCLHALGIGKEVRAASERAAKLALLHFRTAGLMAGAMDDGLEPDDPAGWTTRHMLRADLHAILIDAVLKLDPDAFALDHTFVTAEDHGDHVTASFANGAVAQGDMLLGCDGLKSAVRAHLFGMQAPRFTGHVTWRCLLPIEVAAPFLSAGRSAIFIGPGRFFNRYTVRHRTLVNCVATAKTGNWSEEGWSVPSTVAEFRAEYDGWHPDVVGLIERAPPDQLFKWALFEREPLRNWTRGNIALLGDAAHPMLPFLGLGAGLAIEDAVIFAKVLDDKCGQAALLRYEQARIGRATHIFGEARRQGESYQGDDPHDYLRSNPPASNRALFDYDPDAALANVMASSRQENPPGISA
jgi:salicylate hydroxylase